MGEEEQRKFLSPAHVPQGKKRETYFFWSGGGWTDEWVALKHLTGFQHRLPNRQRWYAKWKLSWNIYTLHSRFSTFGADLHAQSVIIDKISASELSQKFIKVIIVGWVKSSFF